MRHTDGRLAADDGTGDERGRLLTQPPDTFLEARPGFEPGIKALQASALPLGHLAKDDV